MLTFIAVLVAVVVVVLVIAATRPDRFVVQRAIEIDASPSRIQPLINDFAHWRAWSPYERKDPAMQRDLSAVTAGEGACYAWEGNKEVGRGRMEIISSSPTRVAIDLQFIKPFQARNIAEFTLQPQGSATRVTWAMHGSSPYFAKLIGLFVDMDRMIGRDFEAGLDNLKAMAEA